MGRERGTMDRVVGAKAVAEKDGSQLLDEQQAVLVCIIDQRSCGIWNFRSKTVSRSCASVRLIPPPGDAATSSGVRKRKAPTGGTAAQDNALEAGEEEDSIFTDAAKRTKILGGVSGVSSFGVSGFGGWGGGMQASLVGPKWAQLPLGALTSPAPTPALSASRTKLAFHPVSEHRSGSQWACAPFNGLPSSVLPDRTLGSSPAWQQCLALCLAALSETPAMLSPSGGSREQAGSKDVERADGQEIVGVVNDARRWSALLRSHQ